MTIGGQAVGSTETLPVLNPATESVIALAPVCSPAQLDQAVAVARRAFPAWAARPIEERQAALIRMADVLDEHLDGFARLLSAEQGRPQPAARQEVERCGAWFRSFAKRTLPREAVTDETGRTYDVRRTPLGVVGAIAPWNFPMSLAVWKLAPALLAGNTVVLKPSPFTPLATLKLGELLCDLVPPGVINVVSGDDSLGPQLTSHAGVDKIAFTGSTATGKLIMQSAASTLKRLTLELGGNDPAIVLPDVDVQKVASQLFWAAFRNTGQVCIAAKRIYVHADIYDAMLRALIGVAEQIRIGPGDQQGVELGPLQNRRQFEHVTALLQRTREAGARVVTTSQALPTRGYFMAPTFVDNPPDDAEVVVSEPFGPIVPLLSFKDIDEVVWRANDTPYGLGASVWSADVDAAAAVAERLACGIVWINHAQALSPDVPFGGHKQSGLGVENGDEGLLEYTNLQAIAFPPAVAIH